MSKRPKLPAKKKLKAKPREVGNWRKPIARERAKARGIRLSDASGLTNKDPQGRLHGEQPTLIPDSLEVYNHGVLEYLDDGHGNVYDINDPSTWDEDFQDG